MNSRPGSLKTEYRPEPSEARHCVRQKLVLQNEMGWPWEVATPGNENVRVKAAEVSCEKQEKAGEHGGDPENFPRRNEPNKSLKTLGAPRNRENHGRDLALKNFLFLQNEMGP